jgi:Thioredoxin
MKLFTRNQPSRWLLLLVALLVALFTLVACGGDEEAAPEAASAPPAAAGPLKFIYLYSADCGQPCAEMDPIVDQLLVDYKDKILVEKVDAASDQGKKYTADYAITKNPAYVILGADGNKLWSNSGQIHKDMLNQQVIGLLDK